MKTLTTLLLLLTLSLSASQVTTKEKEEPYPKNIKPLGESFITVHSGQKTINLKQVVEVYKSPKWHNKKDRVILVLNSLEHGYDGSSSPRKVYLHWPNFTPEKWLILVQDAK